MATRAQTAANSFNVRVADRRPRGVRGSAPRRRIALGTRSLWAAQVFADTFGGRPLLVRHVELKGVAVRAPPHGVNRSGELVDALGDHLPAHCDRLTHAAEVGQHPAVVTRDDPRDFNRSERAPARAGVAGGRGLGDDGVLEIAHDSSVTAAGSSCPARSRTSSRDLGPGGPGQPAHRRDFPKRQLPLPAAIGTSGPGDRCALNKFIDLPMYKDP